VQVYALAFNHIPANTPLTLVRSLCGVDGAQMLCCEFGIDADDPDACAVCSNAVCYGCAGVDVEPPGAFICGDHQTSTLAATPAAAVAAPKSNSRILLITCPTPDNYSLLLPRPLSSPGRKHDLHAVWLVEVRREEGGSCCRVIKLIFICNRCSKQQRLKVKMVKICWS